jgi:nucleolar protein 58
MAKIISDNLAYAKCIKAMGYRTNAATTDFSSILPEELEEALKAAATISMGTEISITDLTHINLLAEQVVSITQYRAELFEYLRNRMAAIAPNLTALLGELVGARLIAHSGSLVNLAKAPASTIQILGAEKALFRALKTKHDTPKYGLIFHASLVGSAPNQLKGKMARMVAGKTALAVRFDALADADTRSDPDSASIGVSGRAKLEARLRQLEAGLGIQSVKRGAGQGAQQSKFTYGANGTAYNPATDVLIPTQTQASTSKQPLIQEVAEEQNGKKDKKVSPAAG